MSVLKLSTYIVILVLTVGFGLQIYEWSDTLVNDPPPFVTLNDESIAYLNKLNVDLNDEDGLNINDVSSKSEQEMFNDSYTSTQEGEGQSSVTDVLASLNFVKVIMDKFIKPLKFVTNAPTFFLLLFNLPVSAFGNWVYAWNLFYYIVLGILIKREISG